MRIERVVEIEHPGLDMAEQARLGTNGRIHGGRSIPGCGLERPLNIKIAAPASR
jgi:hypothetical protein